MHLNAPQLMRIWNESELFLLAGSHVSWKALVCVTWLVGRLLVIFVSVALLAVGTSAPFQKTRRQYGLRVGYRVFSIVMSIWYAVCWTKLVASQYQLLTQLTLLCDLGM